MLATSENGTKICENSSNHAVILSYVEDISGDVVLRSPLCQRFVHHVESQVTSHLAIQAQFVTISELFDLTKHLI